MNVEEFSQIYMLVYTHLYKQSLYMCNCTLTCGDSGSNKIVLKMLIDLENIFFSLSLTQYTLFPTQTHSYMSEILLD